MPDNYKQKKQSQLVRTATAFLLMTSLSGGAAACRSINLSEENANMPQQRQSSASSANEREAANANSASPTANDPAAAANSTNINASPKPSSSPPPQKPSNAVCPDPKKPCRNKNKEFGEWELSFGLPAKIKPNTNYKSAPFQAIILKTYTEGCGDLDVNPKVEPERVKIQKSYPTRKVFAEYSCANMDATTYEFAGKSNKVTDFIAVYAGETAEEANQLLEEVKTKFPGAVVKRMTANWQLIEQ